MNLDLNSSRAVRARIGKKIGKRGFGVLVALAACAITVGVVALILGSDHAPSALGVGLLLGLPALWWKYDLSIVAPDKGETIAARLSRETLEQLNPRTVYTPRLLWQALSHDWQLQFLCSHLLLMPSLFESMLDDDAASMPAVWSTALKLSSNENSVDTIAVGTALVLSIPNINELLHRITLDESDVKAVCAWLQRDLVVMRRPKQSFGGIGRDWANGFTPRLNRFGHNLSLAIEANGAHFGSLLASAGVASIKAAFSNGTSAVALIGPDGIGKTSHAYALAQDLLSESQDRNLEHHQLVALEASNIISAASRPGELEYILNSLLNETAHAGNIVLFFDDAQLFFQSGSGSFNATQILLPALQSRAVKLIFAMSPNDFQQLKSTNIAFAGLLTPVVLQEPDQAHVLMATADSATNMEMRNHVLIGYGAVKEAYRLSGRYEQDMAYPGKAIRLLEQALSHADSGVVSAASVQAAIEQTTGVKATTAAPVEAGQLLNLEDKIHERMINQAHAVTAVASALRRARAGVASTARPIGSFLFLGPTGVGKTELAKAIAATYFGSEDSMIRLDMSEYQQEGDVARLLSAGANASISLIMRVRQQPFSVVLLDEIEKAHPSILNLLLQLLDEGQLTDVQGRKVSFKDAVVIATSNAGADRIREQIEQGKQLEDFEQAFTDELINSGQFKPELLNRFDEIVLFRPLTPDELGQVVRLMLGGINATLSSQNISVELTDAAIAKIVATGNDPRLGARPMRRALQRAVENTVAEKILRGAVHPGDHVTLDAADLPL